MSSQLPPRTNAGDAGLANLDDVSRDTVIHIWTYRIGPVARWGAVFANDVLAVHLKVARPPTQKFNNSHFRDDQSRTPTSEGTNSAYQYLKRPIGAQNNSVARGLSLRQNRP
jgi:hypothetical protein